MNHKRVLITGITGQDGSYLTEFCLNLGHTVYGMVRRTAQIHDGHFRHLYGNPRFKMVYGDVTDGACMDNLVRELKPDYFVNFAAQSFVGVSWRIPEETFMAGAVGVLKCLEAIRKNAPNCRFYNAGTSEQFGDVISSPQNESHPFRPRSPYGAAKCAASHLVKVYRESYHLYAVQGILFNHESERRGVEFVTRKITRGVARIAAAIKDGESFVPISLGNVEAKRDWSHAEDFIEGVWRMLNQEIYREDLQKVMIKEKAEGGILIPEGVASNAHRLSPYIKEYVLSSNETHSIKEFVTLAFKYAGFEGYWEEREQGKPETNVFYIFHGAEIFEVVNVSSEFYRPAEVELLLGDSSLARKELGWKPKISFDTLVKRMVEWDLHESGIRTQPQLAQTT
jgi:GDPmannose 4,6-dehydratase